MKKHNFDRATVIVGFLIFFFLINSYSTDSFRFVVMSDSHNTLGNIKPDRVAAAIKKVNPRFILHAGDFTCCLSGHPDNRFSFDEFGLLGGIPVFPTTGNHDNDGNALAQYNAFWNDRKPSVPIDGVWAHTYSFDYGGYHFAAIDFIKPDFNRLREDLRNSAGKPTILFSHYTTEAAVKSGYKTAVSKTLNEIALNDPDIKAVFSGHSHCIYKTDIRPGAVQALVGTVSHDNGRDPKYKRKHTFIVVDAKAGQLTICPASVEDGIIAGGCDD